MCSVWMHDEDLVVGLAVVFLGRGAEVDRVHAPADGPVAAGRILGRRDDRAGLVGVHDHRRDDPHGAGVQDHLDVLMLAGGDAGQRDAAGVGDRGEHVSRGLDVGVGVLHVDGQPGEPDPGHEPCGGDAAERQPGADLGLAGTQRPLDWILFQLSSPSSSWLRCVRRSGGIVIDPPQARVSHVAAPGASCQSGGHRPGCGKTSWRTQPVGRN